MTMSGDGEIYDCIVVGSGAAEAVIARELSGHGQKVLILERGTARADSQPMDIARPIDSYMLSACTNARNKIAAGFLVNCDQVNRARS
ncbi:MULTISPECIES: hypothetical protein [unclassified Lysobacter]|uniref:hypothetical protein n=1 Tax=unclassified Lysobacter TaxID=2635362 RepID=UPI001BE6D77F|nr:MULTISPECIES: hypothetical protein [unclassified Lysobacter]MBT2744896.1 hypothetical protein [Lysobacter sp. ISL-42]MBT2752111.1 hypothetical protein [Lysobacter sp. ISL-50]MBT2778608.1 hypothetical protein [Lysobacter sp. ISL-54]MBT2780461.1 hypothetical protein [Lysobacter sp. ISL-52]